MPIKLQHRLICNMVCNNAGIYEGFAELLKKALPHSEVLYFDDGSSIFVEGGKY